MADEFGRQDRERLAIVVAGSIPLKLGILGSHCNKNINLKNKA